MSSTPCACGCSEPVQFRTFEGKQWPIDDDGQAIFWREDRLELVNDPEFSVLPGDADIDAFLEGSTDEPGESRFSREVRHM